MGLTREQCEQEAWAIEPGGRHHHGGAAITIALAWALGLGPLGRVYYLPGLHLMGDLAYALAARHRSRLPGGTPYCHQHPDECEKEE